MSCLRCQHENEAGATFCEECGAPLARTCANCGRQLSPTAKFCPTCAHSTGLSTPSATAQRFGSPESYTPKHLAERILTSRAALEGERKQVTVLFADLKGSMELLADRDPEEARKILDPVLERMMEAVHRYDGTVNQVMGDGIMALFGAPLAHEDHAIRACYAALRMQDSIGRYAEESRRAHGVEVRIRVGLNSGEVVVRSIGSDLAMDYTAVGQTTHLASRMEQLAIPGTIRITGDTLTLAEGYIEVTSLGPVPVKGLVGPVEVYELLGASTVRSRFQAAAARGLTRFVGRAEELNQLREALDRAGSGHGQVVAVAGEPGVGKSRLLWEFVHSHRTENWLVLESSSVSYGNAMSFLPVIELLKGYFQIGARDDPRKIREKVTGKLFSLDRSLEPCLPPLLWLLDVPFEDVEWTRLEPLQRRQRTLDALKRLLLGESRVQPLLVIFEDLHWIDSETQALLDGLVESLLTARILLLVTYRPEYEHQWGGKSCYRQVRVDPFPAQTTEELLEVLLGAGSDLQPLKAMLIERTEGNPFFLEETVRAMVETKMLTGERGAYRLAKTPPRLEIPVTAQALLAARIDRLSPEDKRTLQAAAVIGTEVPFNLLQAINDESHDVLRQSLARLQGGEFLYETRLFPDVEYTFKHALTHEVTYSGLLHARRRALHARIFEAIESFHSNRLTEQVERLAHHAMHGEVWGKAARYFRQAGVKAVSRSAHREAVTCFENALKALDHLPSAPEKVEQEIDLLSELRMSLLTLGDLDRIHECLHRAEALAVSLDDQPRLGRILAYLNNYFYMVGDQQLALEQGRRALAIAERLDDFALKVEMNYRVGQIYYTLGDYRRAIDFLTTSVDSLKGDLVYERFNLPALPSVISRTWLIRCLAERGDFVSGMARGEEAIRIAETSEHPFSLAFAYWGVGHVYLRKGDLGKAVSVLERGFLLCRKLSLTVWLSRFASALGHGYALGGRIIEALPLLEDAMEQAMSMGIVVYRALFAVTLGEGYLRAGRLDDADRWVDRALELAISNRQRGNEAWALWLRAEVAAQREPANVAEEAYRQAIELSTQLEMCPLKSYCHHGLGELYKRRSNRPRASEHTKLATMLLQAMGMRIWPVLGGEKPESD